MKLRLLLPLIASFSTSVFAQSQSPISGFGRFGRINEDGLLTLNVTAHGFTVPAMFERLDVQFGDGTGTATVTSLDTTGKHLKIANGSDGEPTEIHYSLLYPGFSAKFGKKLRLHFYGNSPISIYTLPEKKEGKGSAGIVAIRSAGGVAVTIFVKPQSGNVLGCKYAGGQTDVSIDSAKDIGEVRFMTVNGLKAVKPKIVDNTWSDPHTTFWRETPIPERERVNYALTPDGLGVTITETYKPQPSGETISPLPPVLGFALKNGYPAQVEGQVYYPDCVTKYGDYAYVKGNTLRYTLPLPPIDERGYLQDEAAISSRVDLLNSLVGHLGGDWTKNGVDLAYAGMTNAQMAWAYLSPTKKSALTQAWKTYLPLAFHLPPYTNAGDISRNTWQVETEPFTNASYYWTYFIHGPGVYRYDLDWGNALPLYGLYKYAAYTGDWNFVRTNWEAAQKIYRYFDLGDDWAWMTVVNSDTGYSTGTGDPLAATFSGHWAMLRMARTLGDKTAELNAAYHLAREAIPASMRFALTFWAREKGLIGGRSQVLGFSEQNAYVAVQMGKDDPWNVSSILSGDGSLPELFSAMLTFDRKNTLNYLNEYAQYYPDWYRGDVIYPFHTNYAGNSVYVTFPHIQLRAMLGSDSEDTLWKYALLSEKNRNNAWVGPNVVAELLAQRTPLILTDWTPAAYVAGNVSRDGNRVVLVFSLPKSDTTLTEMQLSAKIKNNWMPKTFTVNGKKSDFTVKDGRLTATIKGQGTITILINR